METARYADALAAEVRADLGRAGLTQTTLAEASGISKATMSRKLSGQQHLTVLDLLLISPVLKTRPSDLMARAEAAVAGSSQKVPA